MGALCTSTSRGGGTTPRNTRSRQRYTHNPLPSSRTRTACGLEHLERPVRVPVPALVLLEQLHERAHVHLCAATQVPWSQSRTASWVVSTRAQRPPHAAAKARPNARAREVPRTAFHHKARIYIHTTTRDAERAAGVPRATCPPPRPTRGRRPPPQAPPAA